MTPYSQLRRRGRLLVLACLIIATQAPGACSSSSGADSPRDVMDAYVKAINAKDEKALLALVRDDRRHDRSARDDAHRLVTRAGGDLVVDHLDIRRDVAPDFASVGLVGHTGHGPYHDQVVLVRHDGRWWLVLGGAPARSPAPTAATTRPA
ncbi:hypothetical protein NE235_12480 [Actinoallomurus spadix]|uniref:Nuclear transport factor 2 family protein n=1 Tax=Actinoallomurus spadix TaxID=79912 RepID=A0ABP3GVQ8_9ACTN|nr:hypothetical protein [Actinoallomurus spadix]MCO5986918.1 hypothetical protein [Actinoallomurus spadix]